MIGTLDYITGIVYCEEHERYDANVFLKFLENILSNYPTGKIVMILDNARMFIKSIFRLGNSGNYSVIGANIRGESHLIPIFKGKFDYVKEYNFKDFASAARHNNLKRLGLKGGNIYKLIIDRNYVFFIEVF